MFRRRAPYDRREVLEAAARDAERGRRRRAIAGYRRVLFSEPANFDVHRRLAPLLARQGEPFEAWLSFRAAGRALERTRDYEGALEVYREATEHLPDKLDAWLAVAKLHRRLGRPRSAQDALREGRGQLRSRTRRPLAIYLLREALAHAPWQAELVLDLADLLARSGRKAEAELWLEGLAERTEGLNRRRVRGAQLRLAPSFGRAWLWLRAA